MEFIKSFDIMKFIFHSSSVSLFAALLCCCWLGAEKKEPALFDVTVFTDQAYPGLTHMNKNL